jgi:hypothetical protein
VQAERPPIRRPVSESRRRCSDMESPTYPKWTRGKALPPLAESVSKTHGERASCLIPPEEQFH